MNLLANAIDAIDEAIEAKKLTVAQIQIRTQAAGSNQVEIRIRDNGMGMTERDKARVFDHFFTTKPIGKGTGLGLSISRQIDFQTNYCG